MALGDGLRLTARTSRRTLPRSRSISVPETLALVPGVRRAGLRGGILAFDGQLEDDARLVIALARTAGAHGARLHTRSRVVELSGSHAVVRDELTGEVRRIEASAVVNAAGVWAGGLVDGITLKPSRGTHLVLRQESLPGPERGRDGARARASATGSCSCCHSPTAPSTWASPTRRSTAPTSPTSRSPARPRSGSCST